MSTTFTESVIQTLSASNTSGRIRRRDQRVDSADYTATVARAFSEAQKGTRSEPIRFISSSLEAPLIYLTSNDSKPRTQQRPPSAMAVGLFFGNEPPPD